MPRIALVTDSTADLPPGVEERHGVQVVPLTVNWEGTSYRDKIDLSTDQFYQRLRVASTLPKTGSPSPGLFEDAYRRLLTTHDAVVSVHLAGGLSATLATAETAARAVDPTRIHVVDSGSLSVGIGWLVERAGLLAEGGEEAPGIAERLRAMATRLRIYALLDTLAFLQKGGRIGRASALVGTLLNVKPIIAVRQGEVLPVERVRTRAAATRRLVELAATAGSAERVAVMHGDAAADLGALADLLAARFPGQTIQRGEIGSVVGTYAGPGLLGVGLLLADSGFADENGEDDGKRAHD